MDVILRSSNAADATEVANVYLESRRAFLPYAPMVHSEEEIREWIAIELIPGGGVTVAIVEERIVGMLAISEGPECSWIDQLYLHPDFIGRGIGTRFLDLAIGSLVPPIRLFTFQQNTGSRRFYERHGFGLVALSDGSENEERCPDALYEFGRAQASGR